MPKIVNHKKELSNELYMLLCTAYGNDWESVKKYTNINGWCRLESTKFPHINKQHNRIKYWWWRPKTLDGFIGCA